ncbi:SPX domain-containing protein [Gongronella butleri]|nr:SPX domain-containing protein [Gongronella butleri]
MKFAKQLEIERNEIPSDWHPYLIHYKQLKKALRFVVEELHLCLPPAIRAMPFDQRKWTYGLQDNQEPQPYIEVVVPGSTEIDKIDQGTGLQECQDRAAAKPFQRKIDLIKDSEFLRQLLKDLEHAQVLQNHQVARFRRVVQALQQQMLIVTSPKKKDLDAWRAIFQLYIAAALTNKNRHHADNKLRFAQFWDLVRARKLNNRLSKGSKAALTQFLEFHNQFYQFQHFVCLNSLALTKILKKHDKRSGLSASTVFVSFAQAHHNWLDGLDGAIFDLIQANVVSIVPQPDDYSCPVCFGLTWRPIRLECQHVFCLRCIIKAHRQRLYDCPVCRKEMAIGHADATFLDEELQTYLLAYFPREIQEKRRDNKHDQTRAEMHRLQEQGRSLYQPNHKRDQQCLLM